MLNNLDPDAYAQLSGYLSSFKGNSFRADALMRLSWFYLTLGDTASAFHWANKGLKIGTLPTYADKQAKHELESIKQVNAQLIQARLLYDAGKPLESKNLLLKNAWLATLSPSEYHYRLARALHDLNSHLEALPHYKAAIANNTTPLKYYAPFSALMVAQIENELGNRQQSLRYAKLCLSINKGEYANDIKTKAQELIKTLGQQSPATK